MVAPDGAGPWPQMTSVRPRLTSCTMMGTSPPGPFRCGSTTCNVKAVATPASKALPPFSSVAIPTAVAIQWVEVTTPKVPSISGRVVNGSGLMLLAMGLAPSKGAGALDHSVAVLPTGMPAALPPLIRGSGRRRREVDRMAGDAIDQRGRFLPAEIEGQRTARVEGAARRRIDRVRD